MNAGDEQGVAFGGWCFSKAQGGNLAHLRPFPWCTGDQWRAPDLLPWRWGAEGVFAGDLPTASSSKARPPPLDHQQAWPGCMGPDMAKGQYSAISPKQLVLKRHCCFVKMLGSGRSEVVDLIIQINSLAGKQNSLSRCCCRHWLWCHCSALRQTKPLQGCVRPQKSRSAKHLKGLSCSCTLS